MDLLKAELERKKALKQATTASKPNSSDAPAVQLAVASAEHASQKESAQAQMEVTSSSGSSSDTYQWDDSRISERLRRVGAPVRYFGESEEARIKRLQRLEKAAPPSDSQLNDHSAASIGTKRKRPEDDSPSAGTRGSSIERSGSDSAAAAPVSRVAGPSAAPPSSSNGAGAGTSEGSSKDQKDKDKEKDKEKDKDHSRAAALEFRASSRSDSRAGDKYVYKFWRGLMHEWEGQLAGMGEADKASLAGRTGARLYAETDDNLKPFFRALKHGEAPADIKGQVMDIVDALLDKDYKRAGDAYIKLAVGNAQWLIGVSQVGLHERAAREKVYLGKIQHVMNDETQRKYIISLKRLMTWMQEQDPGDPSKMLITR